MRSNLVGYVIGLATTLATSWSTRRRRQWHSLFGLLGFALRFAIAFPVCLWLYSFLYIAQHCALSDRSGTFLERLVYCPLLAWMFTTGEFFDFAYDYGAVLPQVLLITFAALVISVAWGAICRHRWGTAAGPLPRTVRTALKKAATGLTTMVLCFIGRFAIATPICWCIYAWVLTRLACHRGPSGLCALSGVMAPLFLLFGPIAREEEDPPNYYEPVLVFAVIVTVVWTVLALVRKCRRTPAQLQGPSLGRCR